MQQLQEDLEAKKVAEEQRQCMADAKVLPLVLTLTLTLTLI